MLGSTDQTSTFPSPLAVGLRVANVRRAAEFYQKLGFIFVMAVPDENEEWLLCLMRYGSGSILLGPLDHLQFPRSHPAHRLQGPARGLGVRIDVAVSAIAVTYAACTAGGCKITAELVQEVWGDRTFSCLDPHGYEWRFTEAAKHVTFDQIAQAANGVWS